VTVAPPAPPVAVGENLGVVAIAPAQYVGLKLCDLCQGTGVGAAKGWRPWAVWRQVGRRCSFRQPEPCVSGGHLMGVMLTAEVRWSVPPRALAAVPTNGKEVGPPSARRWPGWI
jgi:hypothetical protein